MTPSEFIHQFRFVSTASEDALLDLIRFVPPADPDAADAALPFRESLCEHLLAHGSAADRPLIRQLLEQEVLNAEHGYGMTDTLKLACFLLFRLARAEDSLPVWIAKTVDFDTMCGLDVQLCVGGGVETTLAFLDSSVDPRARRAAEYIRECEQAGDFSNMPEYRTFIQRYFASTDPSNGA